MDYTTCDLDLLLAAAKRAGLHYSATAPTLTIWGTTTDETDAIAAALRSRADEVVTHLRTNDPVTLDTDDPDTLTGDLPLSVLRALVIAWTHDTHETIAGEQAWERQIARRDGKTAGSRTPRSRRRPPAPPDRIEY
jgi:hypothetical protein